MHPGIAAALIAGRDLAEREAAIRRSSGAWWLARLRGHPRISVIEVADSAAPGWLRFPVLIATDQVDDFSTPTMRSLGVMPAYPIPLGRLPGFAPAVTSPDPAGWPAAKLLAARLFTLPTHSLVSEGDRARLARLLRVPA
jgi:dTDP-4-amino-4,6-dideoxygalactose transaminase